MKHKKKFTPHEDARICEMARKAAPVRDIAKALERPDRAIRDRMDRLVADGRLSREARLSTKTRQPSAIERERHDIGAKGQPPRVYGASHFSAFERAKAKADQMIAAGCDPSAARNEIMQLTGLDIGDLRAGAS